MILSPVFCSCENLVSPVLVSLVPESNLSTGASSVEGQQGGEGPEAYYLQREAERIRFLLL